MRKLIERKQITINGKKIWAEVPRKLTPKEKEKVLERLYRNIAKIAEHQEAS